MATRTVMVVGASGFIGGFTCEVFAAAGWRVVGIGSRTDGIPSPCQVYRCLRLPAPDFDAILAQEKPDAVIHCAGSASVPGSLKQPASDYHNNCVVTFAVLEALRVHSPQSRFVFLSSAAVYGNPGKLPITEEDPTCPISPYGFHKLQCELMCQEYHEVYKLPTVCLRIFSGYGPGLRRQILWDMCSKLLSTSKLHLDGTGRESRDFIHVRDIARAILLTVERAPLQGEKYNLANGVETIIFELANLVCSGFPGVVSSIDFSNVVPQGVPSNWLSDSSKIAGLGFEPEIALPQGIQGYCCWFESDWDARENRT